MIIIDSTHCHIPWSEAENHYEIMEQITYLSSLKKGSLPIEQVPWKLMERYKRAVQ